MREFWETKYKPASNPPATTSTHTINKPPNAFLQWLNDEEDIDPLADEYDHYISQSQVPGVKQGYKWWLEPTQQKIYPNLSKMALDILSIPSMSADPERLFSGAKITVSDRRNRLGIYTLEALECLKSWLNIEVFMDDDDDDGLIQEEEEAVQGELGGGVIQVD
jgi:hAT family C-terminal dimerisation region